MVCCKIISWWWVPNIMTPPYSKYHSNPESQVLLFLFNVHFDSNWHFLFSLFYFLFLSSGSLQGPSSVRGAGKSRGLGSAADPPTLPQLPSAPWTVPSSHAQKQAAAASGPRWGRPGGAKFKQTTHHVLRQRPPCPTQTQSCSPGAGQKEQRPPLPPARAEYRKFKW